MITINSGTDTRNFVKKIMEFANKKKKNEIFDDDFCQKVNFENEKIIKFFKEKSKIYLKKILIKNFLGFLLEENLIELKNLNISLRKSLRELCNAADTEIEPEIFTYLLNGLMERDFCFGVCPGGKFFSLIFL